jgi:hypothetical protein
MSQTNLPKTVDKFSRRKFFAGCAGVATGFSALNMLGSTSPLLFADTGARAKEKTRIRLVFSHPDPTKPNWPNINYDFTGHIEEVKSKLKEQCPGIIFLPVITQTGTKEEAGRILKLDDEVDGYVIYLAGCLWGDLTETLIAAGKPTVMIDNLFAGSGEFLTSYAWAKRAGHKVIGVSSSRFEDIADAVRCIDTLNYLNQSTALVVGSKTDPAIEQVYGTTMQTVEFAEINEAYKAVKLSEAQKTAERWISEAEKIIEPSGEDIKKSAAMYLAMHALMTKHAADAITINCLGGIYGGNMVEAYPCLGFMQLDNDGLVGACEADQRSTMTKLLMSSLTEKPGFISDPVIDTATNRIIYAHCVGPTKVFGPDGKANPFHLRSHSEDRKGACNRSMMPLGEKVTTIMFDHVKRQVILHQGTTVENVDDDKACRTKLAVEVDGDIDKLMLFWDEWGWHRVTFYGDHKRQVKNVASLLGFEVIEEA